MCTHTEPPAHQGFYHCVARYGYMNSVRMSDKFVNSLVDELHAYVQPGIQELESEAAASVSGAGTRAPLSRPTHPPTHPHATHTPTAHPCLGVGRCR